MRVGIIGCGKIADEHAHAILAAGGAEIVGVCDREELMANQFGERLGVLGRFTDPVEMLRVSVPDVVHITTPPQAHFALGKLCVENGCHVLLEKPFTVTEAEAVELVALAENKGLKLAVGHNHQFSHAAMEMRRLVRGGFLGGPPVHMESIFCYNMRDERYAKALLGDRRHWVRELPGKLLHNVISHGVCKIVEFLNDNNPAVKAEGFSSEFLHRIGQADIVDELRVIIREQGGATAYFTFSSQISPPLHQFRIHGPKNSLWVDYSQQWVLPLRNGGYKSYLNQFVPPVVLGTQFVRNGLRNIGKFLRSQFHEDTGRRRLVKSFYDSIRQGGPVPIPYREIIGTAWIMDRIFQQISQDGKPATYQMGWTEAKGILHASKR